MTKVAGFPHNFFLNGYNVSGDVGSAERISNMVNPLTVTGIDKRALERIAGLRDGGLDFTTYFNDADDQEHEALSGLPTADVIGSWFCGVTLGDPVASIVAKQTNYDLDRPSDASLKFSVELVGSGYGLEWGRNLSAQGDGNGYYQSLTAENLTGYNDSASAATNFGLQMYVHLLSFTGTSITIKLQDSNDDAGTDPYADITGATTTAMTTKGAQRIQTSRTENVKEWVRVVTTGTYSEATFALMYVRNRATINF